MEWKPSTISWYTGKQLAKFPEWFVKGESRTAFHA